MYDLMAEDTSVEWTCKELLDYFGLPHTEENIKDMSNRAGYLVSRGHAQRVRQGTYQAVIKKGTSMTDTDTAQAANGLAPQYPSETVGGGLQCPHCDFVGRSPMGIKSHITRNHRPGLTADQAFERIGAACEVLFPDGIPMSRIIEIAELQKRMLSVVTRS